MTSNFKTANFWVFEFQEFSLNSNQNKEVNQCPNYLVFKKTGLNFWKQEKKRTMEFWSKTINKTVKKYRNPIKKVPHRWIQTKVNIVLKRLQTGHSKFAESSCFDPVFFYNRSQILVFTAKFELIFAPFCPETGVFFMNIGWFHLNFIHFRFKSCWIFYLFLVWNKANGLKFSCFNPVFS